MRRRKTGRDGFQGWSPSAAAAWDRIFGAQESLVTNPHKSLTALEAAAVAVMRTPGPMDHVLTPEQAAEIERSGIGRVARIPIKSRA